MRISIGMPGKCIGCWRFFFSSRRRHTRYWRDWSSDVCSSDLSDHSDQLGRLFRGGLFNGIAGCETASGGCEAEVREGSAKKSSSLAREHYSVHHRRSDYHWPRWSHHFGEYGSEEAAAELRP